MIVRPMQAAMDGRAFRSFMAAFLRFVVSNVWKTPTYNVILAWDPDALPADWEAGRQRYFTINWSQLATTWTAFALFLVALVSL
ncbi:MAG TPA: hypothetical protein VJN72_09890 [Gaiellales bacterium]|nr:hypothetical protein [Gaiellales bacterium]